MMALLVRCWMMASCLTHLASPMAPNRTVCSPHCYSASSFPWFCPWLLRTATWAFQSSSAQMAVFSIYAGFRLTQTHIPQSAWPLVCRWLHTDGAHPYRSPVTFRSFSNCSFPVWAHCQSSEDRSHSSSSKQVKLQSNGNYCRGNSAVSCWQVLLLR